MSKESAAPEKSTSRQIESAEGGESMGASMAPPAFQLMASESPIQRQETDAATATGTVQERYAAHSLTEEDLTDDYVIEQFAGLSIEQLFEYRRQATTEAVKVHILTLIDGRERDPYQSYLGKKFTINDPAAVIRDTNGTALRIHYRVRPARRSSHRIHCR